MYVQTHEYKIGQVVDFMLKTYTNGKLALEQEMKGTIEKCVFVCYSKTEEKPAYIIAVDFDGVIINELVLPENIKKLSE